MKTLKLLIVSLAISISCDKAKTDNGVKEIDSSTESKQTNDSSVVENTTGAPKLNPAHGEPFHRCDIEVGQPLDSAPAPSAPAPVTSQAPTVNNNPLLMPSQSSGAKPATNPAHGEPHHRCDLAVGAPLS